MFVGEKIATYIEEKKEICSRDTWRCGGAGWVLGGCAVAMNLSHLVRPGFELTVPC